MEGTAGLTIKKEVVDLEAADAAVATTTTAAAIPRSSAATADAASRAPPPPPVVSGMPPTQRVTPTSTPLRGGLVDR